MRHIANPDPHRDRQLVQSLRDHALTALTEVLGGHRDVALLDFPYHRNAGDAAIWLGEMALLRALGVRVRYICDLSRYEPRRLCERLPEGPILLSGGGNLGDLWRDSQLLRERVLSDFPDRAVVQLPQSVYFADAARYDAFRHLVEQHGRYTLMLRDDESMDRVASLSAVRVRCPDMAFGLGPLEPPVLPTTRILCLARDDVEGASGLRSLAESPDVRVADWTLGQWGERVWRLKRAMPRAARLAKRRHVTYELARSAAHASWASMARQNVRAALRLLSSGQVVVTDRLHAHLLCVLLGRDHVVLDNSYGKLSALDAAWLPNSTTTHWADSADQAVTIARELLDRRAHQVAPGGE